MSGVMPPFEFPKNLKDLPWETRQKLYQDYLKYQATSDGWRTAEIDPSQTIDPDTMPAPEHDFVKMDDLDEAPPPSSASTTFDPEKGYVVSGEDPYHLYVLGRISKEDADKLMANKEKPIEDAGPRPSDGVRQKVSGLPGPAQDAVERFGRL